MQLENQHFGGLGGNDSSPKLRHPHDLQKLIPKTQDFEETYPNHSDIFRYIQIYHQLKNCFFTNQHADVYPPSVISVISFMTSADLPPQRRCSDLDGARYRTGPVRNSIGVYIAELINIYIYIYKKQENKIYTI